MVVPSPPEDELLARDKFSVFHPLLKDQNLSHKIDFMRLMWC